MQFNSVLFPAPESCYKYRRIENIVYIPNPPAEKVPAPEPQKIGSVDTGALPPKEVVQESPTDIKDDEEEEKKPSDEKKAEDESKTTEDESKEVKDESKENPENTCQAYIPCLYLPNPHGADKILIFFHGNAEDIGWAYDFVNDLKKSLGVHVLAVEYPGYSLYIGTPNADQICQDAEVVYDYLTQKVGIKEENIILFGRSIGSGPATHLAARRNPSSLVLMSAYTSISAVVKNIAGVIGKWFVAERFKNIEEITKIRCPVLFIHGMMDKLIPKSHAEQLLHACVQTISHVKLSEKMTHNDFDMEEDITKPLIEFMSRCGIKVDNDGTIYEFSDELYIRPRVWEDKSNKPTLVQKLYDKFFQ